MGQTKQLSTTTYKYYELEMSEKNRKIELARSKHKIVAWYQIEIQIRNKFYQTEVATVHKRFSNFQKLIKHMKKGLEKHRIQFDGSTHNLWDTFKLGRFGSKQKRLVTEINWGYQRASCLVQFLREICKVPELLNHDAFKAFLGYGETQPLSYTHH